MQHRRVLMVRLSATHARLTLQKRWSHNLLSDDHTFQTYESYVLIPDPTARLKMSHGLWVSWVLTLRLICVNRFEKFKTETGSSCLHVCIIQNFRFGCQCLEIGSVGRKKLSSNHIAHMVNLFTSTCWR